MPTVGELLTAAARRLQQAGVPQARDEAQRLLARVLGTDRGGLFVRRDAVCAPAQTARFAEWVRRRASREPAQHLTGEQEFHGLVFGVDRRGLIPRPETEGLVDAVLQANLPDRAHVADLGTGSGCIAIALAVRRADLRLHALDRSAEALELARENARRHGVDDRIELLRGDFGQAPAAWCAAMAAVVSNPPYVREDEWAALQPEVRDHDPREALVAGPQGTEGYRALLPAARRLLQPGGLLALELGFGQSAQVQRLAVDHGFEAVAVLPDLAGIPRVLTARCRYTGTA